MSQSINRGLLESRFGLVILSKDFFAKRWTEYELQSLIARVVGGENVILPIWHNVTQKNIRDYNLYLSDIKALSTEIGVDALALEIIKRVRPDILNSHVRIQMSRHLGRQPGRTAEVPLQDLKDSPIRHRALSAFLVISCRLIAEVFADVLNVGYQDMVEGFSKDWDYEREFVVWSSIANAYVQFIRETHCDYGDIAKKKEAVSLLLQYSMSGGDPEQIQDGYPLLSPSEQWYLIDTYLLNLKHIKDMVKIFDYQES